MVKPAVGRGPVEIECAAGLGSEHAADGLRCQVGQRPVVEHAGKVKDALQRPPQLGDTAPDILFFRHVSRDDVELDLRRGVREHVSQTARPAQPVRRAPPAGVAVHQGEMPRP